MTSPINLLSIEKQDVEISNFVLHKNGITPKDDPNFEDWTSCMQFILHSANYVHWWIGDMLNYGEKHYGKRYVDWIEKTGFDYQTLRNDKWVSSSIDLSRRRDHLSF